jgi:cation transport regulator ChaB
MPIEDDEDIPEEARKALKEAAAESYERAFGGTQ